MRGAQVANRFSPLCVDYAKPRNLYIVLVRLVADFPSYGKDDAL